MVNVADLVKENNEKRNLLTKENEVYYTDLLVYVRLQWRLSEYESETVLLEMLDHLLDGQEDGKNAEVIFGEDPLVFADQLIAEIAPEKGSNNFYFLVGLASLLLGLVLVIRGLALYIFSLFTDVTSEINIFQASLMALVIVGFIVLVISVIFNTIKRDLFKEEEKRHMNSGFRVGLTAAISMAIVLIIIKFTPEIGPSFVLSPILSLGTGILLLFIYYVIKISRSECGKYRN